MRRYIIYRHWDRSTNHEDFLKALQAAWIIEDDEKEAVPSHESKKHEHVFKKEVHTQRQPRCKWCTAYLGAVGAKRTWWYCEQCNVPLCKSGTCFSSYHDEDMLYKAKSTKSVTKENRRKRMRVK